MRRVDGKRAKEISRVKLSIIPTGLSDLVMSRVSVMFSYSWVISFHVRGLPFLVGVKYMGWDVLGV
jgi:hypothetical protein